MELLLTKPVVVTLAIIGAVLGASIVVSLAYPRPGAAALGGVRSEEVSR